MKKKLFRLLIILFLLNKAVFAQTVDETFILAQNHYNHQQYFEAIYYYQRVIVFAGDDLKNKCYYSIANCYDALEKYDKASEFYELSYAIALNDSIKNEIKLKKTSVYLKSKNYYLALVELLDFIPSSQLFETRKELYLAATYFFLGEFDKSENLFLKISNKINSKSENKISEYFRQNENLTRINIKKAKRLSTIIPGLGQLYLGETKQAINSSLLVASLLGLTAIIGYNYGIIDAALSILPWAFRYYSGGIKKVEIIAMQKIDKNRQEIFYKILNLLQK